MAWRDVARLTVAADDIIAERKEQRDRVSRERAVAAGGGGWTRY